MKEREKQTRDDHHKSRKIFRAKEKRGMKRRMMMFRADREEEKRNMQHEMMIRGCGMTMRTTVYSIMLWVEMKRGRERDVSN